MIKRTNFDILYKPRYKWWLAISLGIGQGNDRLSLSKPKRTRSSNFPEVYVLKLWKLWRIKKTRKLKKFNKRPLVLKKVYFFYSKSDFLLKALNILVLLQIRAQRTLGDWLSKSLSKFGTRDFLCQILRKIVKFQKNYGIWKWFKKSLS